MASCYCEKLVSGKIPSPIPRPHPLPPALSSVEGRLCPGFECKTGFGLGIIYPLSSSKRIFNCRSTDRFSVAQIVCQNLFSSSLDIVGANEDVGVDEHLTAHGRS